MKVLLKLSVALMIVGATYFGIQRVAEEKANALAGGGTYALNRASQEERRAFALLLEHLREWGEDDLASTLAQWQEAGDLRMAPGLAPGRSAVYVSALGLVSRIFIRLEELVPGRLPFPDLDIPEKAQRRFGMIRLAGTLYHELQHADGLEDEGATYDREIDWYLALGDRVGADLEGEERHWFEWAVDSAVETAVAAREMATGSP